MKNGVLSFAVAMSLSVSAVASDTVYSWRGEKSFVWRDVTNTAACAVLVSPSSSCPFAKAGLAMPVLGDGGILYRDRIVYGVSALVQPGDFVRLVAELEIPRCGDVPSVFVIESSLGKEEWNLVVSERQFPEGRNRRVFLDLWQHPWAVARYFQVEPFSPAHYERMRPLWEQLADAGQKVITTTIMNRPWAHQCFDAYGSMVRHIRKSDGTWKFDYSLFDEYVSFAESCGLGPQIHCYSIFPFRLKRYYWEDESGQEMFGDFDVGSKEFTDYWRVFLDDFAAHLKQKGWFERTYIAMDERSPEDLKAASDLVKAYGRFKIAMAGDRPPSLFDGIEIDNFSMALQCVTPKYIAEAVARRGKGRTTSVYVAGGNPCTGTAQPPIDCMWLGAYPGAMDLDGFLRWAYCSWPANPDSDTTYSPWFGHWSAGGTYLVYPNGPSIRFLALKNGLNLSEKIGILRAEGRIDSNLAAILEEFQYKGPKKYPLPSAISNLLDRTERAVHRLSEDYGRMGGDRHGVCNICMAAASLAWPEPTREMKPWAYNWWMGSAVDKAGLEYQCRELADKGFGGFHVIPIYGAKPKNGGDVDESQLACFKVWTDWCRENGYSTRKVEGDTVTFSNLPLVDYPLVLAERAQVKLAPDAK